MKNFDGVEFLGTFRSYQQRVLDSSENYYKNNRIHIVAAPGSGKTILGLELIRRLNSPCIVFSPTNTIRYQWGDRFEEMFLPKGKNVDTYVSFDLFNIKPITSVTYQALHSAIDKVVCEDEEGTIDYSNIDMFKLINEYGIKTICVDEAHHLQNEWQKALEKFIKGLDKDIKIIALTATPPYDASPVEWQRYIDICGEIDEEIFVTELVQAKNLCPHQDYVYLNYPTEEESLLFNEHKNKVNKAFECLKAFEPFNGLVDEIFELSNKDETIIYKNKTEYECVFALLKKLEKPFNERKVKKLLHLNELPEESLKTFEKALNFLISSTNFHFGVDLKNILKKEGVIEKNNVCLEITSKLEKSLLKSLGKLESISQIVSIEYSTLKEKLRLLVLTDFIRGSTKNKIGTNDLFKDISVVSVFETIRRINSNIKLAILSGGLVVLPSDLEQEVKTLLATKKNKVTVKPLNETGYSEYIFNVSNKEKVSIVNQLFEKGEIQVIVGTKSLLGEGWDSPCINSLIMATFVGSFMLSNQMRGRAIRVYKADKKKTANIWHLVTLEPEEEKTALDIKCNEETSTDYKTLKRRFNCFVGPHYTKTSIETGIERISILKNTYSKETLAEVNKQMEALAVNREEMAKKWIVENSNGVMHMQSSIPYSRTPKGLNFINIPIAAGLACLMAIIGFLLFKTVENIKLFMFGAFFICLVCVMFCTVFLFSYYLYKVIALFNPMLFIKSISKGVLNTLVLKNIIEDKCTLKVTKNKTLKHVEVILISDNLKQQKTFHAVLGEVLSVINEPRYVICKNIFKQRIYKYSYQVPSIIANNKHAATIFQKHMHILGTTELLYAKNIQIKPEIFKCQKHAYINNNSETIELKQKL